MKLLDPGVWRLTPGRGNANNRLRPEKFPRKRFRTGVQLPPPPPRRRGRHIVRGDFFTKVTSHSFCRGSFPNRTRYRWAPVWVRRCAAVFSGHQKISILDRRDRCGRIARPAIRPAALLRRTSVFAFGENLGTGQIHFTRVFEITEGWSSSLACETQKERHDFGAP